VYSHISSPCVDFSILHVLSDLSHLIMYFVSLGAVSFDDSAQLVKVLFCHNSDFMFLLYIYAKKSEVFFFSKKSFTARFLVMKLWSVRLDLRGFFTKNEHPSAALTFIRSTALDRARKAALNFPT
jgi:hypothetical protein